MGVDETRFPPPRLKWADIKGDKARRRKASLVNDLPWVGPSGAHSASPTGAPVGRVRRRWGEKNSGREGGKRAHARTLRAWGSAPCLCIRAPHALQRNRCARRRLRSPSGGRVSSAFAVHADALPPSLRPRSSRAGERARASELTTRAAPRHDTNDRPQEPQLLGHARRRPPRDRSGGSASSRGAPERAVCVRLLPLQVRFLLGLQRRQQRRYAERSNARDPPAAPAYRPASALSSRPPGDSSVPSWCWQVRETPPSRAA